jgi:hypothetical protein
MTVAVGSRVTFNTPGRFSKELTGTVESIDGAFAVVNVGDRTVKARPATLRAA